MEQNENVMNIETIHLRTGRPDVAGLTLTVSVRSRTAMLVLARPRQVLMIGDHAGFGLRPRFLGDVRVGGTLECPRPMGTNRSEASAADR
jgi:hypothetical protein